MLRKGIAIRDNRPSLKKQGTTWYFSMNFKRRNFPQTLLLTEFLYSCIQTCVWKLEMYELYNWIQILFFIKFVFWFETSIQQI